MATFRTFENIKDCNFNGLTLNHAGGNQNINNSQHPVYGGPTTNNNFGAGTLNNVTGQQNNMPPHASSSEYITHGQRSNLSHSNQVSPIEANRPDSTWSTTHIVIAAFLLGLFLASCVHYFF